MAYFLLLLAVNRIRSQLMGQADMAGNIGTVRLGLTGARSGRFEFKIGMSRGVSHSAHQWRRKSTSEHRTGIAGFPAMILFTNKPFLHY